jgi:hypothetical protein
MSNNTIENTENTVNVKRRGRPKGPSEPNFIEISVEDLMTNINSKNLRTIKVSRTWLNKIGNSYTNTDSESGESVKSIEFTVS